MNGLVLAALVRLSIAVAPAAAPPPIAADDADRSPEHAPESDAAAAPVKSGVAEADVPSEPDPDPEPDSEPVPAPSATIEPVPVPEPSASADAAIDPASRRVSAAPFAQIGVANREAELRLGGDLVIAPRCRDGAVGCSGGRIGFVTRFPMIGHTPRGDEIGRSSTDALDGFAGSWRVGLVGDYIGDLTRADETERYFVFSLGAQWGVKTYHFFRNAGADESAATRHSFDAAARVLYYAAAPRRHRVAPQLLVHYTLDWASGPLQSVVQAGSAGAPDIVVERVIDPPAVRPAFVVGVPVLFTVPRGVVLRQLGFGPALSWAAVGDPNGYDPFGREHTVRLESWLYWYPAGRHGFEAPRTTVRLGVAPYVDAFLRGRIAGRPQLLPGALFEVKIGVRNFEI